MILEPTGKMDWLRHAPELHKYIVNVMFVEPEDLNILGVILESTGKLAWLRHAPELHKYITEELGGVLLEKHTKTGLNTSNTIFYTKKKFNTFFLCGELFLFLLPLVTFSDLLCDTWCWQPISSVHLLYVLGVEQQFIAHRYPRVYKPVRIRYYS